MTRNRGFGLVALLASVAACDDIHVGDPWDTFEVRAESQARDGEHPSSLAPGGLEAPAAVVFHWNGVLADEVWVDHCLYDCDAQPDDWCWSKGEDDVDGDWSKGADEGEGVFYIAACSTHAECAALGQSFYEGLLDTEARFGEVPDGWFEDAECSQDAPRLEEGEIYTVGVAGYDCSEGEPCKEMMGCTFFTMEGGAPRVLRGTTR